MKTFVFSLLSVLRHRERIEEQKRLLLAARQRDLGAAQDHLANLDAQFKRYSIRLRGGHKDFSSEDLRAHYAHLEYLDRAMIMQHGIVSQCRLAVDRARADLMGASKERKAIDKLKERRLQEHQTLEASVEQKELDDSNNRRYVRNTP